MKAQLSVFIILGIMVAFSVLVLAYVSQHTAEQKLKASIEEVSLPDGPVLIPDSQCFDTTQFNACSVQKPLYCAGTGILSSSCQTCGCPTEQTCDPDGSCKKPVSQVTPAQPTSEKNTTLPQKTPSFFVVFVPLNYDPEDQEFKSRTGSITQFLKANTKLTDENFIVLPKTISFNTQDCAHALDVLQSSIAPLFAKMTIKRFNGQEAAPYRIIGIDKNVQSLQECGCAFTYLYSTLVYVGGHSCSKQAHVALHELGHTFGLCDEYDTCEWQNANEGLHSRGTWCQNTIPNQENSNCGTSCCKQSAACCSGKYADSQNDGFVNVMGSANVPPARRMSTETGTVINAYLCQAAGVC